MIQSWYLTRPIEASSMNIYRFWLVKEIEESFSLGIWLVESSYNDFGHKVYDPKYGWWINCFPNRIVKGRTDFPKNQDYAEITLSIDDVITLEVKQSGLSFCVNDNSLGICYQDDRMLEDNVYPFVYKAAQCLEILEGWAGHPDAESLYQDSYLDNQSVNESAIKSNIGSDPTDPE